MAKQPTSTTMSNPSNDSEPLESTAYGPHQNYIRIQFAGRYGKELPVSRGHRFGARFEGYTDGSLTPIVQNGLSITESDITGERYGQLVVPLLGGFKLFREITMQTVCGGVPCKGKLTFFARKLDTLAGLSLEHLTPHIVSHADVTDTFQTNVYTYGKRVRFNNIPGFEGEATDLIGLWPWPRPELRQLVPPKHMIGKQRIFRGVPKLIPNFYNCAHWNPDGLIRSKSETVIRPKGWY